MITIIADPHAYRLVAAGALRASAPAAYVPTRIAIRRALDAGQPLVVHVTDRLLIHWLDDLEAYANVQWERVTPEDDFRRCFGREPGPPFTTALLIALDIAHLPEPPP